MGANQEHQSVTRPTVWPQPDVDPGVGLGAWRTLLRASRSAPAWARRTVGAIWSLIAIMLVVQFWLDFDGFAEPLEVVEAASVVLALAGLALLGAVFTLQKSQQVAAGEPDAVFAETRVPTQILLVLPFFAFVGGVLIAMALGMVLVRGLLHSREHLLIALLPMLSLAVVGRIILGATRTLYGYGRAQAAAAERAHAEAGEARMTALQAQMNPHFLFNTLNTVAALVQRDPDAAERTIENLAAVLRRTLDRSQRPLTSVREEVEDVHAYLDIEQQRLGKRLRVEFDVEPLTLERLVPTLTLQPLVENALRHGVGARIEGGTVRISVRENDAGLRITVEDDGPGFPARPRDGMGLGNLRRRLETLYGARAALTVGVGGGGARVTVQVPTDVGRS
jgi:two-component sensor histidine kinase